MTDVCLLPIRPSSVSQFGRLSADLAAAHARGEHLGSRVPRIHAGSERLLELSCAFQGALDGLDRSLTEVGLLDPATCEALRCLVGAVERLAGTAQRFPANA
ncbi:hypothetical protein [Methylobacterium oryzae]|uniref:hypothetical protein n=1 Tax=Methylobacterium oryzae TaxID=334852 RepID=UPI002F32CFB5